MIERTLRFPGPASPGHTLAPQRRGPGDPCFQIDEHGAIWRTSLQLVKMQNWFHTLKMCIVSVG